ncbi:MAG: glycosyltransferase family 4 protein [Nitrososphaera sp.]|nr:glycosyltransferase family 4 protein [Nitrososphaera sp.]
MRVFVYQGYYQAGGTYMAYHIGRVLSQHFGLEVLVVGDKPESTMFSYPLDFLPLSHDRFLDVVRPTDILICNPSFSHYLFGLRLNCKKLCYVQNIRTFSLIDVFFDHFIFVSHWVKKFVTEFYGVSGNVIPAFINTKLFDAIDDWSTRLTSVAISSYKCDDIVFSRFVDLFRAKYPNCKVEFDRYPVLPQTQFAALLQRHRYYLSLAVMEGFGLPMLEAMAAGCTVVGWDAGGSSEYAVHGKNCLLARYGDLEVLADHLYFALSHPNEARKLAQAGHSASMDFDIERFDKAWMTELSQFLDLQPV